MQKQPKITEATRKNILNSFWTLFQSTPLDKITAGKLSEQAGIHRSSFYRYFSDIYEVFDAFQLELLENLSHDIKAVLDTTDIFLPTYTEKTADILLTYADKLYRLLNYSDCNFKSKLIENVSINVKRMLPSAATSDYVVSLLISVMLSNFNFWYEHQENYTLQEINAMGQQILLNGLNIK